MKTEKITVAIELSWNPRKEDKRGALAATFASMAEGIANGRNTGPLPNKGSWELRDGAGILQ